MWSYNETLMVSLVFSSLEFEIPGLKTQNVVHYAAQITNNIHYTGIQGSLIIHGDRMD